MRAQNRLCCNNGLTIYFYVGVLLNPTIEAPNKS